MARSVGCIFFRVQILDCRLGTRGGREASDHPVHASGEEGAGVVALRPTLVAPYGPAAPRSPPGGGSPFACRAVAPKDGVWF